MVFALGLAAAALGIVGAATFGLVALFSKTESTRRADERPAGSPPAATPSEAGEPAAPPREPPPAPAPRAEPAPEASPAPTEKVAEAPPAEWPPARAFTARCRASGGGCAPECTELAGGRCLDPCFIHTAECSKDCLRADGTCGFPPPDVE